MHLHPEHRDRRAQFVRRVGDETLLALEGLAQALEQAIHRIDHRLELRRATFERDRRQLAELLAVQLLGELPQRAQAATDHEPDQQPRQRQPQHHRHDRLDDHVVGQPVADVGTRRRHDHHVVTAGEMHVGAPAITAEVRVPESRLQRDQRRARNVVGVREQPRRLSRGQLPVLERDVRDLVERGEPLAADAGGEVRLFLQLTVEQPFGLGHAGPVPVHRRDEHHQHQHRQRRDDQEHADRTQGRGIR